jgi:hypothetical protein
MTTQNVQRALDRLYEVFAGVPKPAAINACPCCLDSAQACRLLTLPLQSITPAQLSSYAASVFLTVGSEEDYRYLLPRILDVSLAESSWWPSREIVLRSLALAEWDTWAARERQALGDLFDAAFEEAVSKGDGWDVDRWICGLAFAGADLSPYLARLEQPDASTALLALHEINANALLKGKLSNAFWAHDRAVAQPVIAWLRSAPVQAAIWRHYGVKNDG